ncbi:hypothetical protein RvY_13659 [Ramazzottius varieornatus]|uniref:Uncharacterized protein n=1 Tax=Ramazzottius varieornatus TaxID=947166 RepID=A0A1D1VNN3_RAMVA|nr:hypothetical protein RvY_13659 [Ramazzottius varieornatus]
MSTEKEIGRFHLGGGCLERLREFLSDSDVTDDLVVKMSENEHSNEIVFKVTIDHHPKSAASQKTDVKIPEESKSGISDVQHDREDIITGQKIEAKSADTSENYGSTGFDETEEEIDETEEEGDDTSDRDAPCTSANARARDAARDEKYKTTDDRGVPVVVPENTRDVVGLGTGNKSTRKKALFLLTTFYDPEKAKKKLQDLAKIKEENKRAPKGFFDDPIINDIRDEMIEEGYFDPDDAKGANKKIKSWFKQFLEKTKEFGEDAADIRAGWIRLRSLLSYKIPRVPLQS